MLTSARPRSRVRALTGLGSVLALLLVAACSGEEAPPPPPPVTQSPTVEPSKTAPPEPVVPIVWPLTGVETAELVDRPAIAVKIENTTSARPQAGLEAADVVWETIVEFEVSRFIAVFHSQLPGEFGPIRSVRPMDPAIIAPLNPLFVYSGGQGGILAMVNASPVQSVSHDRGADGIYRVSSRRAPHNVYGDPQRILPQADAAHSASPQQQFTFADSAAQASAVVAGASAATVSFQLSAASRPSWSWDAASGRWLRSEGATAVSSASGERLSAVNVVSVTAPHPNTGFGAQGGAPVPTYDLVGEGEAMVASGGHTVTGTWRKASEDAPLQLFGADGQPLLLAPGNTWVELVPAGKGSYTIG